jgi:AmiR/NasT family two-component response regulator
MPIAPSACAGGMTGQPIWSLRFMDRRNSRNIEELADANPHMRRLTRMMLMNIGAKLVYEGADGLSALDIIRHANPDVMLLDREMPLLGGP